MAALHRSPDKIWTARASSVREHSCPGGGPCISCLHFCLNCFCSVECSAPAQDEWAIARANGFGLRGLRTLLLIGTFLICTSYAILALAPAGATEARPSPATCLCGPAGQPCPTVACAPSLYKSARHVAQRTWQTPLWCKSAKAGAPSAFAGALRDFAPPFSPPDAVCRAASSPHRWLGRSRSLPPRFRHACRTMAQTMTHTMSGLNTITHTMTHTIRTA